MPSKIAILLAVFIYSYAGTLYGQICTSEKIDFALKNLPAFIPIPEGADPNEILNQAYECTVTGISPLVNAESSRAIDRATAGSTIGSFVFDTDGKMTGIVRDWWVDTNSEPAFAIVDAFLADSVEEPVKIVTPTEAMEVREVASNSVLKYNNLQTNTVDIMEYYRDGTMNEIPWQYESMTEQLSAMRFDEFPELMEGIEVSAFARPQIRIRLQSKPAGANIFIENIYFGNTMIDGYIDQRKFDLLRMELEGYNVCRYEDGIFSAESEFGVFFPVFSCIFTE